MALLENKRLETLFRLEIEFHRRLRTAAPAAFEHRRPAHQLRFAVRIRAASFQPRQGDGFRYRASRNAAPLGR